MIVIMRNLKVHKNLIKILIWPRKFTWFVCSIYTENLLLFPARNLLQDEAGQLEVLDLKKFLEVIFMKGHLMAISLDLVRSSWALQTFQCSELSLFGRDPNGRISNIVPCVWTCCKDLYMAPEIYSKEPLDTNADTFSYTVILFGVSWSQIWETRYNCTVPTYYILRAYMLLIGIANIQ